ncbi:MAG: hypothetical protein ACON4Y_04340 [Flavobacteriales bacterium]
MINSRLFWRGAILGLILPLLAFVIYSNFVLGSDIITTYIQLEVMQIHTHVLSLCTLVNILPFFLFLRAYRNEPAQGILFSTFIIVISVYIINFLF